jgi:hypothetical protein
MISSSVFLQLVNNGALTDPYMKGILDYGIAGALIFVIVIIFKFFQWLTEKENRRRDKAYADLLDRLNAETKSRDDEYKHLVEYVREQFKKDNEVRDYKFQEVIHSLTRLIEKTDNNYNQAIDKFINVIQEQMDSNSYLVSELTKLQEKIESMGKANLSDKNELLNAIKNITILYEIKSKVKND